jgi:hypothetical protein
MQRKTMYDMDEKELGAFIAQQQHVVAKLSYEKPGSAEHGFEAGGLEDARQLLAEKRKNLQR